VNHLCIIRIVMLRILMLQFYYILCRPGDDWKKTLKLPPKDLRIKTSDVTSTRKWVWRLLFETGVTDGNFWNGLGKAISYSGMFSLFIHMWCYELSIPYFLICVNDKISIFLMCIHVHIHTLSEPFKDKSQNHGPLPLNISVRIS